MNRRRIIIFFVTFTAAILTIFWLNSWKDGELRFGLVYHHPVGDYTDVSKLHWLGSPTQFAEIYPYVEPDLQRISKAGYKSILFHVAIACLKPYDAYPLDFNYSFLKQNVKWIADEASSYGLEVYVLYYPDWRCPPYNNSYEGYYYDEGSDNWNLMIDFTNYLVTQCESVKWAAPFCLTNNMTAVQNFFDHLNIDSKVLIHADQPFVSALISNFSREAPNEEVPNSRNRPKLLEVYDDPFLGLVKNYDEHIITGQKRDGNLTQSEQINEIKAKITSLGTQRNTIIWCYADYPDSSPEDLGIVQSSNESLPPAWTWNIQVVQTYWTIVTLLAILAIIIIWFSLKENRQG